MREIWGVFSLQARTRCVLLSKARSMRYLSILLILGCWTHWALGQEIVPLRAFEPLTFSENLQIPRYQIRQTFLISDTTFLLIGRRDSVPESEDGWRLLLMQKTGSRFQITQVMQPAGESYIYRPSFYQWGDRWLIFCELGAEYSWGVDGFLWDGAQIKSLGHLPVAAGIEPALDYAESILPFLRPAARGDRLQVRFADRGILDGALIRGVKLILNPGKPSTRINISPADLRYSWNMEGTLTRED